MSHYKHSSIKGVGKAFGTFGELLQGVLPSNRNFLVTFPINMYSYANFSFNGENSFAVELPHKKKAAQIVKNILEKHDLPLAGKLLLKSEIPEGKGMASSSADLVAAAKAVSSAYHLNMSHTQIESFMSEIEPSDGVMYDACVSYYQREVLLKSYLGVLPNLVVLAIDEGGMVDTIEFSKRSKNFTNSEKLEYEILLKKLENAVRKKDIITIGQVATRSAILSKKFKSSKYLDNFIHINKEISGIGVAIAHSGTCLGLLLDASDPKIEKKIEDAKAIFSAMSIPPKMDIYKINGIQIKNESSIPQ